MKATLLAALLLFLSFTSALAAPSTPDSLSIKIGQMLMIGFRGMEAKDDSAIAADIRERGIGGVVLFDYDVPSKSPIRNIESPEQLRVLPRSCKSSRPLRFSLLSIRRVGASAASSRRAAFRRPFPPLISAHSIIPTAHGRPPDRPPLYSKVSVST